MKKFNFPTREIVNVPVMIPDGLQAFLGAVCMLEKKWFVQCISGDLVVCVLLFIRRYTELRGPLSVKTCDEATFGQKHCCPDT